MSDARPSGEVHAVATLFPMLAEDEQQAREHVLMLLRGASADIAAAQRYLEDFALAWPELDIDVEGTMAELRSVAGL
jgi:hypothetical protein